MSATRTRRGVPLWPRLTLARIIQRDGPLCPHCGQPATTVQHRQRKGSGGSNAAERPSNGIGLCFAANDADANVPGVRPEFERWGWTISRYDDPAQRPWFDVVAGHWWIADDAWDRRPWTPEQVG